MALRIRGEAAGELRRTGSGIHSEMVFVFTDQLLQRNNMQLAGLDAILLSAGPGSYTGLRVGSSAVKGMLFGSDTGFFAVNTLAAIAMGAKLENPDAARIHAVLDARREHLYHQDFTFDAGFPVAGAESRIRPLADFGSIVHAGELMAGTGIHRLPDGPAADPAREDEHLVSALNLIALFDRAGPRKADRHAIPLIKKVAPERFEPYY